MSSLLWKPPVKYEQGKLCQVDMNSNQIVLSVHESATAQKLCCRVGKRTSEEVEWGDTVQYDSGVMPHASLNDSGLAVEVHKSENADRLYYHVGVVDPEKLKINWGYSTKYETGVSPKVALRDSGHALLLHQEQGFIWVSLAEARASDRSLHIKWKKKHAAGTQADIAVQKDGDLVIETHVNKDGRIEYMIGTLEPNHQKLTWENPILLESPGSSPSVCFAGKDLTCGWAIVLICYQSAENSLCCQVGKLDALNKKIIWAGPHHSIPSQDPFILPCVASDQQGKATCISQSAKHLDLYYSCVDVPLILMTSLPCVGLAEDQNSRYRRTMEDEFVVVDNFTGKQGWSYLAIYDGHGGRQTVEIVRDHLHNNVAIALENYSEEQTQMYPLWKQAFEKTDETVLQSAREARFNSGSTAAVCLIRTLKDGARWLHSANIGDARNVLNRGGKAMRLTYDHKSSDPEEIARVEKNEKVILLGKVGGSLAVSRAFGDMDLKKWVICDPFCTDIQLTEEDTHLIVACDGLWDVVSDQEAIDLIRQHPHRDNAQALATLLLQTALQKGTKDNTTIIVACL